MDQQAGRHSSGNHELTGKRINRNEDNLRDLRDNIKYTNIHIIVVSERKNRAEKNTQVIMPENFPNLGKETDIRSRKHRESQMRQGKESNTKTNYKVK